jgi:hypothetical protein
MDGKRIVEFQSRQQLTLPVWQDIVEFYGSMPEDARPENLVTIVSSTQIDREVVDNVLGPIVGRKGAVTAVSSKDPSEQTPPVSAEQIKPSETAKEAVLR